VSADPYDLTRHAEATTTGGLKLYISGTGFVP